MGLLLITGVNRFSLLSGYGMLNPVKLFSMLLCHCKPFVSLQELFDLTILKQDLLVMRNTNELPLEMLGTNRWSPCHIFAIQDLKSLLMNDFQDRKICHQNLGSML